MSNDTKSGKRKRNRLFISIVTGGLILLVVAAIVIIVAVGRGDIFYKEDEEIELSAKKQQEIALENLNDDTEEAVVLDTYQTKGQKLTLTFEGMADVDIVEELLASLEKNNIKAIFFVSGEKAREYPDSVRKIFEAGHEIANNTLRAEKEMQKLSAEELVKDFSKADTIIQSITGLHPNKLRCYVTEYNKNVKKAAGAMGYDIFSVTDFLNYQSFSSQEDAQGYVDKLKAGDILSVKFEGNLDPSEYAHKEIVMGTPKPAESKVTEEPKEEKEELSPEERFLQVVDFLATAIARSNYDKDIEPMLEKNAGKLAETVKEINTTQRASAFQIYGIGDDKELENVLEALKEVEARATFYITSSDIENHSSQVRSIIEDGHEIGVAMVLSKLNDAASAASEILSVKKALISEYNYDKLETAMLPWGDVEDFVLEAISATGLTYIEYDTALLREASLEQDSAQSVVMEKFGERAYTLMRGQTLFLRMGFFENNSEMLASCIIEIDANRNIYEILPVQEIISNEEFIYTYPAEEDSLIPSVKSQVTAGKRSLSDEDLMRFVEYRYIGNPDITGSQNLPGFTESEQGKIDKTGRIKNDDKAVFLTFDDWGTDKNITKLLDVLKKHDAKATFFVRTEFVADNPNLLRAIAEDGHDIASHTHTHYALANGSLPYESINEEQASELVSDLVTSYEVLESIVGDVENDKESPALTPLFRSPTMAISKRGIRTAFDTGFEFIVNGEYSSHDYEASSAETLASEVKANLSSGTVVIMHMSDNSIYTADALDILMTENEEKPEEERFKFARISDYLRVE